MAGIVISFPDPQQQQQQKQNFTCMNSTYFLF